MIQRRQVYALAPLDTDGARGDRRSLGPGPLRPAARVRFLGRPARARQLVPVRDFGGGGSGRSARAQEHRVNATHSLSPAAVG